MSRADCRCHSDESTPTAVVAAAEATTSGARRIFARVLCSGCRRLAVLQISTRLVALSVRLVGRRLVALAACMHDRHMEVFLEEGTHGHMGCRMNLARCGTPQQFTSRPWHAAMCDRNNNFVDSMRSLRRMHGRASCMTLFPLPQYVAFFIRTIQVGKQMTANIRIHLYHAWFFGWLHHIKKTHFKVWEGAN
jgi:hypothetical protein